MRYIDEFRDKKLIKNLAVEIRRDIDPYRRYNIMEVCGTHTMNIFRFGLKDILPKNITLLSGPGCPVCVTPNAFLDKAIAIAGLKDVVIATFGDMLKVPGSYSSLEKEKAGGSAIKIVYSPTDALEMARKNTAKEIVFLGVGFETTAPTVAASILAAKKEGIENYSVLCGHKTMPEALSALVAGKGPDVDAFLLPGHVSAIIGAKPYEFLSSRYKKPCVIAGFEPIDILEAILMVIRQRSPKVEIEYTRLVNTSGNRTAQKAIAKVFEEEDSIWRGVGRVKNSGLKIRKNFSDFDAERKFKPKIKQPKENKACMCGDVLKGVKTPPECKLFGKTCTPAHPIGACMVSTEGACAAYFKYRGTNG